MKRQKSRLLPVEYRIGLISKENQQLKEMASKKTKKKESRSQTTCHQKHLPIRARLGNGIKKKQPKKGPSPKLFNYQRRSPKHFQNKTKIMNDSKKIEPKENIEETIINFNYNDITRLINEKINKDLKKLKIEQQNDFPELDFLNIVVSIPTI